MNIEEILDEIDELIDNSASVPFVQHKRVVDGERLRELINDVRLNMNQELKEAKEIERESQKILNNAKASAEDIVRRAEDRAEQLVSKERIVIEARKKAVDMITKAQNASKSIQQNAALSIAKMLNETEANYTKNLQNIKLVKSKISNTLKVSTNFNNNNPDNK
ncbi:MAG: vacuolar-type H+-ATPase subunit H [Ruminococcus sp.]|nr:vacuolar-type H+-ATPase subunit H [Ruminococcus sp.]MDE6502638.1 vacuolar-type H+-ATPase subunit H [Ruminococcus sp.]MDE6677658.1 vacuolar-type H+-ATPase subunit H [Ruminococcus sp.]